MSIVYRQELGRELTWSEADNNFAELKAGVDSKKSNFDVLPVTQGGTGQTSVDAVKIAFDIATKTELASSAAGKGAELVEYQGATVEAALDERLPEIGTYALLRAYTGPVTAFFVRGVERIFDGGFGVFRVDAADTTTADNGGTVLVDASGRRWKRDYSGAVNIKWFGAKGDGVTYDTDAINAAITAAGVGGELLYAPGTYLVGSSLIQLLSQAWRGLGGQRAATIKKGFNGDLIIPGSLGSIVDINLDANGANYTGRGIHVTDGFSIEIRRVRISQSQDVSLEFDDGKGGGSCISDFEADTTNQTVVPAIKIQDSSAPAPKFFKNIWLSGGLFDLSGGGNGSSISNFYIHNFVTSAPNYPDFTSASILFHAENGRVASIADTTTISGADLQFSNIAFSGPVYLDKTQGVKLANCSYGAGITENASTCRYNEWSNQLTSYTPTWTQASGAQPSLGDGTLTGQYIRTGYRCAVSMRLVIGSTTTTGNSATAYVFSLPFNGHIANDQRGLPAMVQIGSTMYTCWATISADQKSFTLGYNAQAVRDGYPAALTAGSSINVDFEYNVK